VAAASAGPYAILHLIPNNQQPRQHPTTQLFTDRMPFLPPNQQCQSTEGRQVSEVSMKQGANDLHMVQLMSVQPLD